MFRPILGNVSFEGQPETDWSQCFLCQSFKAERLTNPALNSRGDPSEGYRSLANKLLEFDRIGRVPFNIKVEKLNVGNGLAAVMERNNAVWHHSCYACCSSSRLKREHEKLKRALVLQANKENVEPGIPLKCRRSEDHEGHEQALSAVIRFMNDARTSLSPSQSAPVFYMTDLAKKYSEHLKEEGVFYEVHTTRLKERLLDACPTLEAIGSQGREIILTFKKDVDSAVRRLSSGDFQAVDQSIVQCATLIRQEIAQLPSFDWKHFDQKSQDECVPQSLNKLLKMILYGPSPLPTETFDPVVNSLAQTIRFHYIKRRRSAGNVRRHDRSKECPVPVYVGLKMFAETRQKELIDVGHKLGVSISYDRLQTILTDMANRNVTVFEEQGVVCPASMRKGVFTTGAADNLDHNTSSSTAMDSFHGTAISLLQHPLEDDRESYWNPIPIESTDKTLKSLPKDYAFVNPCILNPKNAKLSSTLRGQMTEVSSDAPLRQELEWLEGVANGRDTALNWASHHAAKEEGRVHVRTPSAVLPLFKEQAATTAMMQHAMTVVKRATNYLNPGQTAVMVVDEPLFALCQCIQQLLPDEVGTDKVFIMMGALHIEMRALHVLGEWAESSGWTDLLTEAGILSEGRADALLKGSHVTRTRHAHEVTAAVLYTLLKDAYDEDGDFLPFDEWRKLRSEEIPQFAYWETFLKLELTMLQFVRSIRTANFELYKETLSLLMPWFFALDHINYARWCSVHVRDLLNLAETHPDLAAEFRAGHFVGRNSTRNFSAIALDHLHEQINATLKSNSGMIGLTENADSLLKWTLSGPDVAAVVDNFEKGFGIQNPSEGHCHHNDSPAENARFRKDVAALRAKFLEYGNPFLEKGDELYNVFNGKVVVDQQAVKEIMKMEEIGLSQYKIFATERLEQGSKSLFDPLTKNNFKLMTAASTKKVVSKVASLKNDVSLFSRLWMATHVRKGDMREFFKHENQALPPSLTANGAMRKGEKSEIVPCLIQLPPVIHKPNVDVLVLDGAVMVNMIRPGSNCRTILDYAEILSTYLSKEIASVLRVDVVFDVYINNSLKAGTREKRGDGERMRVSLNARIPASWQKFLKDDLNKQELFQLLAEYLSKQQWSGKCFLVTRGTACLSSTATIPGSDVQPCNHEEADTRLMLHASSAAAHGFTKVMIRSVDSDVVILAVWTANEAPHIQELWVSYGVGKHHKYIPAHEIARTLGPEKCTVLPTLHALSGCDNTSSMAGVGKKTAFDSWQANTESSAALLALSTGRVDDALLDLEKLVIHMYSRKSTTVSLNDCRKELFSHGRQPQSIPPTQDAFKQHCLRVAYQATVWGQSLTPMQELPSPAQRGWQRSVCGGWEPRWTTIPEASKACKQLVACKCKQCKPSSCSCLKKTQWKCSDLCRCPCLKSEHLNC